MPASFCCVFLIFTTIWSNFYLTFAVQDEFLLLRHLLNNSHYNSGVRPVKNSNNSVRVKVDIVLNQIIDMVSIWFVSTWCNSLVLAWNALPLKGDKEL